MNKEDTVDYLPPTEFTSFMHDLRDIVNLHKEYLLFKTNVFFLNNLKQK